MWIELCISYCMHDLSAHMTVDKHEDFMRKNPEAVENEIGFSTFPQDPHGFHKGGMWKTIPSLFECSN